MSGITFSVSKWEASTNGERCSVSSISTPAYVGEKGVRSYFIVPTTPRFTLGGNYDKPYTLEMSDKSIKYKRSGVSDVVLAGTGAPLQTFIANGGRLTQPTLRITTNEMNDRFNHGDSSQGGQGGYKFNGLFYGGHFNHYENTTGMWHQYRWRQVELNSYTVPPGTTRDNLVILVSCKTHKGASASFSQNIGGSTTGTEIGIINSDSWFNLHGEQIIVLSNGKAKQVGNYNITNKWRSGDQCYGASFNVQWLLYYNNGVIYLQRRDTMEDFDGHRGRVVGPEGGYQGWQNWHTWLGQWIELPNFDIYISVLPNSTY